MILKRKYISYVLILFIFNLSAPPLDIEESLKINNIEVIRSYLKGKSSLNLEKSIDSSKLKSIFISKLISQCDSNDFSLISSFLKGDNQRQKALAIEWFRFCLYEEKYIDLKKKLFKSFLEKESNLIIKIFLIDALLALGEKEYLLTLASSDKKLLKDWATYIKELKSISEK